MVGWWFGIGTPTGSYLSDGWVNHQPDSMVISIMEDHLMVSGSSFPFDGSRCGGVFKKPPGACRRGAVVLS